jgi:hypothetical protein
MKSIWTRWVLATVVAAAALLAQGCSGINADVPVSPALFLLKNSPAQGARPGPAAPPAQLSKTLPGKHLAQR